MDLIIFGLFLAAFGVSSALPLRESIKDNEENRATGNVKFYLYTKANPETPQQLFLNDEDSIRKSNFEKSRHTKVIIHGWGGSYTTSPNPSIRRAYFTHDDYNIISIDWYEYSRLNYVSSRAKVPIVGEDVAEFLDFLNEKFGLNYDKLVVIGHSLGAHVAGFCGKSVNMGKISAIVGLDPAYPIYSYSNTETRLASDDAKYVQTIQTNGNMLGFLPPIGSASFYPNWGRKQPGCGLDIDGGCAHGRSVTYYAESIIGYSYAPVIKCDSYDNISERNDCEEVQGNIQMGDPMQIVRKDGIFYLETNSDSPYGHIGDRSIKTVPLNFYEDSLVSPPPIYSHN